MNHSLLIQSLFQHTCQILKIQGLCLRQMKRLKPVKKGARCFRLASTNLKTGVITLDFYTPRKRQPKKKSSILRILAHEIAHHQKKPYKQFFRGRWINRQHYPRFYKQVNKNIEKMKKDKVLGKWFK